MKSFNKILVPTELSEISREALEYAKALARMWNSRIYLINVVDIVPVVSFPSIDYTADISLRDAVEQTKRAVGRVALENSDAEIMVTPVVRQGVAYKEIIRFVLEEGIDLVVMTTNGRTGLPHFILGSVAEKVVNHSPVPVLTVKHSSLRSSTPDEQDLKHTIGAEG